MDVDRCINREGEIWKQREGERLTQREGLKVALSVSGTCMHAGTKVIQRNRCNSSLGLVGCTILDICFTLVAGRQAGKLWRALQLY